MMALFLSASTDVFMKTLPIMLYGMLGIFFAILMIYIFVVILNRTTRSHSKDDEAKK